MQAMRAVPTMKHFRRVAHPILVALLLAGFGPFLGGCSCKEVIARDITVTLDNNLVGKPVEVDLYGANGTDLASWSDVPIEDYWKDGNVMRSDNPNKGVLIFDPGGTETTKVFPATDKLWDVWKRRGGSDLVILAEIPGSAGTWKGDPKADPRRQVVPLSSCYWDSAKEPIRVQVHSGSISIESAIRSTPK